jgi:hypothetical protein
MNLPTGVNRALAKSTALFNAGHELEDLAKANFSGYLIETLLGKDGVDEAAIIFRNGQIIGSVYEYYGLKKTVSGDEAVPHVMNAFAARHGIIDTVELSVQQVDLTTAFNASIKLANPIPANKISSLAKQNFDSNLSQKVTADDPQKEVSRSSLFKKFGLAGLDR